MNIAVGAVTAVLLLGAIAITVLVRLLHRLQTTVEGLVRLLGRLEQRKGRG